MRTDRQGADMRSAISIEHERPCDLRPVCSAFRRLKNSRSAITVAVEVFFSRSDIHRVLVEAAHSDVSGGTFWFHLFPRLLRSRMYCLHAGKINSLCLVFARRGFRGVGAGPTNRNPPKQFVR